MSPEILTIALAGGEKRFGLHLNEIKKHFSEDVILEYIKANLGFQNVNIRIKDVPNMKPSKLKFFVLSAGQCHVKMNYIHTVSGSGLLE